MSYSSPLSGDGCRAVRRHGAHRKRGDTGPMPLIRKYRNIVPLRPVILAFSMASTSMYVWRAAVKSKGLEDAGAAAVATHEMAEEGTEHTHTPRSTADICAPLGMPPDWTGVRRASCQTVQRLEAVQTQMASTSLVMSQDDVACR
jgi:hypothetical protein